MLEILESGETQTATDLASRLDVDERTVRRNLDHLLDLEVPIWSERGRHRGYRLAPGFRVPPLMLTDEEALAVVLGLVAGKRRGDVVTSPAAMESALTKLRRVLPDARARRLDAPVRPSRRACRSGRQPRPAPVTPAPPRAAPPHRCRPPCSR